MREIHFRAKYLDSNDFIYGYYVYISNDVFPYKIIDNKGLSLDVDGETIGQYTGLHDKNGKEIYEGDIIQYKGKNDKIKTKGEVKYSEEYAQYVLVNTGTVKDEFEPLGDYNMEVFKVIRKHI